MKKTGMLAVIFSMVFCLCAGCSSRDSGTGEWSKEAAQPLPDEIFTMQIGHGHGVNSIRHRALKVFQTMVEERTDGGIIVDIFPAGQLGTEIGMHREVEKGTLQGVWGGGFDLVPKLIIFTLPFLADNEAEMYRLLDSDFIMDICKEAEKSGVEVLGIGAGGGFRQFSNHVHPIKRPEDMKGLRMRVNEIDTIKRTMEALGAEVVPVLYNDTYDCLKSGRADGQDNPWNNIVSMHFFEVQKYITKIDYQFHPNPFYVNAKWLHALPEDYQKIVRECAHTMVRLEHQYVQKSREEDLEKIKAYSQVYELSPEERQAFKEATSCVYDAYLEEGIVTQEELDTMRKIMDAEE